MSGKRVESMVVTAKFFPVLPENVRKSTAPIQEAGFQTKIQSHRLSSFQLYWLTRHGETDTVFAGHQNSDVGIGRASVQRLLLIFLQHH